MNPTPLSPMSAMNSLFTPGLLAVCALVPAITAQQVVAVKAGKVVTVTGPVLEDVTILIRDGMIVKIGKDVEVPLEAKVIDAADKTVLPTWVLAHSFDGMRGSNENLANVPYLTVMDGVDPSHAWFRHCLANGVGTIHVLPGNRTLIGGQGIVVRPSGRTVEDMAVRTHTSLKLSLLASGTSRMGQIQKMRRAFKDVEDYVADFDRRKAEFEKEKEAGAIPEDKEWEEEYDKKHKPVIDLLEGKLSAFVYVPGPAEVEEALRLAKRFKATLVVSPTCQKAAGVLARLKAPIVLDAGFEYYEKDEETEEEHVVCSAKVLADQGIPFALSLGSVGRGGVPQTAYPWWQLATAVRHGVDRKTALESLTVVPARILGLEDEVGSIEEGKVANLQILTGDPFLATTWVDTVLLEGEVVYRRSEDPRLKHLFGTADKDGPK